MSDLHEQANEIEAGTGAYDVRLKDLLAIAPLHECSACFAPGTFFANHDHSAHVPVSAIERLAALHVVHFEGKAPSRTAVLTS